MKKFNKETIKTYAKEHKKQIIIGSSIAGAAVVGVAGLWLFNRSKAGMEFKNKLISVLMESIVRDNHRTHTIHMTWDHRCFDSEEAVMEIWNAATDALMEAAHGD